MAGSQTVSHKKRIDIRIGTGHGYNKDRLEKRSEKPV